MTDERVPIACDLSAQDAVGQAGEWSDLVGRASAVQALPDGARMRFPLDLAAVVADLVEREADCCRFLDLDLRTAGGELVLDVRSASPGAWPVISALTGVAKP